MEKESNRAYSGKEPYIFLSYAHASDQYHKRIKKRFEQDGYRVWDDEGIKAADKYPDWIAEQILGCTVFVCVVTKEWVASDFCDNEFGLAAENKKTILPIIMEDVDLRPGQKLRVGNCQYVIRKDCSSLDDFYNKIYSCRDMDQCREEHNGEEVSDTKDDHKSSASPAWKIILPVVILVIVLMVVGKGKVKWPPGSSSDKGEVINVSENTTESGTSSAENTTEYVEENKILGSYCSIKDTNMTNIPIYAKVSDSRKKGEIPEGRCCLVTDSTTYDDQDWYYVSYFGIEGWAEADYFEFISKEDLTMDLDAGDTEVVYCDRSKINIRENESMDSQVIVTDVPYGDEMQVLDIQDGQVKVSYQGKIGYTSAANVDYYASKYWKVSVGDGINTSIKLRKAASEDSEVLAQIPEDTVFQVSEFSDGWGKVTYNNKVGWIKLHYAVPCDKDK